jgi:predicted transcriptional regulator
MSAEGVRSQQAREFMMKTIPLKPERQAELEEFARRSGKTPADALDEALAAYLEWERGDMEDAVQGIQKGYDDMKAGRSRPASEFLADMRRRYGLSR